METSAFVQNLCNVLSLSVVTLCLVMKVPQIVSVAKSGDTKGISLGSVLLEQCGYSIMLSYNFAMGYPAASYLEYPFLVIQDLLVLGLIFHTRDMISLKVLAGFILYMVAYVSLGYRLVPDFILTASIVSLERVLGLTATTNATLACDPNTSIIAYPAGNVVVLYNPKKNKQSHIFNFSKKTLTAVAFSADGKYLVSGESGLQPAVRVWDVADKVQVAEHHGHKFGISCVAFSPNMKYIVSVGTQHDMMVNVWNWRTGSKVASNKVSSKVATVAFSADNSYFVTVGMRHVKFWYLDSSRSKERKKPSKKKKSSSDINTTVPLNGRNGILGNHRNNFFCDVVMGSGKMDKHVFCITQSGFLCQFSEKRQMDKWVDLRTPCANCISAADDYIFIGCANGIVRAFNAQTLHFVLTLPRPHYLGVDVAAAVNSSQLNNIKDGDTKYPDTLALVFDEEHRQVTCVYNDHSLYMWDVHDMKKIGKKWSFLYHSSCVYGIEVYPMMGVGQTSVLPQNSFFTCSSDDTIRIWNIDPHMPESPTYKSNIYSHELLKIMYMDPSLASLCDVDYNPSGAADKTDRNYDDKNGIRSITVSPDGQHLASGDRQGNVRIHELYHLSAIKEIEAHESEVLCLEYSNWDNGPKVLASSSRDRLVHVYDTEQQYGLLQTLSDHSAAITAVKFTETDGHLKMLTCGADKSILFRNLQQDPDFQFTLAHHLVEKMTLYDMCVEPSQKFAAIGCQDRNIRIYNVKTGTKKKEYKGSLTEDGILLRVRLDPSGTYAATSCSDKNLCIIDFYTGELLATMYGHSEIPSDVRFMNDLKHVLSVSGDGCIFVWRLPAEMTSHMQSRLREMGKLPMPPSLPNGGFKPGMLSRHKDEMDFVPAPLEPEFRTPQKVLREIDPTRGLNTNIPGPQTPDYRFSVGQLPSWAKQQESDGTAAPHHTDQGPRGRWAERVDQGVVMKSQDGKTIELDLATDRRRFTYEADMLTSQLPDSMRRETMVLNRPSSAPKNMPVIFDESAVANNDDDDDDFLPSRTFSKVTVEKEPAVNWDDLFNFDTDELDQPDNTEIIYYPPSDSDGSDQMASSYQIYDAKSQIDKLPEQSGHNSFSKNSIPDADSETTDPISLEDTDDDDSSQSSPNTPLDDPGPKVASREKFLKDTFENLSFTPGLTTDTFVKNLDTLEEEISTNPTTAMINSRISISAKFMSKSQQANMRNMGMYGGMQRQDNWFDGSNKASVQRRKDDMARNLDESRRMIMAMGWKPESPDGELDDLASDPSSSPPTKLAGMTTPKTEVQAPDEGRTPTNYGNFEQTFSRREHSDPPPTSPRSAKSLRRCWSTLDLPKSPIPEEKPAPKSAQSAKSAKSLSRKSGKACSVDNRHNNGHTRSKIPSPTIYSPTRGRRSRKNQASTSDVFARGRDTTPTSRKSMPATTSRVGARPRTLVLDTPKGKPGTRSQNKSSAAAKKLSVPSQGKLSVYISKRSSTGSSNLNKVKSTSLNSLGDCDEVQIETNRPRSTWSKSKMASFTSVPNLLISDDEDDAVNIPSSLKTSSELSRSVPDVNDEDTDKDVTSNPLSIPGTKNNTLPRGQHGADKRRSTGNTDYNRRSASTSRLSAGSRITVEDKKGFVRSACTSVSSVKRASKSNKDRALMPPPALPAMANTNTKQDSKCVKRAQQVRRKTTSDLTLEQAKDILKGNSGILNGCGRDKDPVNKDSSSSPSCSNIPKQAQPASSSSNSETISPLNDPAFLNVASEIEQTAAELRHHSGEQHYNFLDPSPHEPPERDIPPDRDIPAANPGHRNERHSQNNSTSSSHQNDNESVQSNSSEEFARDSLEDDVSSPSVRERIERLNQHVTNVDRLKSDSPYRNRLRSQSPGSDMVGSPRMTSTIQVNFSKSKPDDLPVEQSVCSEAVLVSASSTSSSASMATSTSSTSEMSPNHSHVDSSVPPIQFDISNEINNKSEVNTAFPVTVATSSIGVLTSTMVSPGTTVSSVMSTSVQSLSPQSAMTSSLDSEGLHRYMSPGSSHSNQSPQSCADTGLGSDTDTDISSSMTSVLSVFRRDQLPPPDPMATLNNLMRQMQHLSSKTLELFSQLESRQDEPMNRVRENLREINQAIGSKLRTSGVDIPADNDTFNLQVDWDNKVITLRGVSFKGGET